MKKSILPIALALCLSPVAAYPALLELSLGGYGSFYNAEDLDEAYGAGGKLKLDIIEYFAVDARVSYVKYDKGGVKMVPYEATAMLQLPLLNKTITPCAGVGVGYYTFHGGSISVEDKVGVTPMLGAELRLGKKKNLGVFAEARWLFLKTDLKGESGSSDLSGVSANLGLAYHF